jgi:hypothetical protein
MKLTMLTFSFSEKHLCPHLVKRADSVTPYHTSTSVGDSEQNVPSNYDFPETPTYPKSAISFCHLATFFSKFHDCHV